MLMDNPPGSGPEPVALTFERREHITWITVTGALDLLTVVAALKRLWTEGQYENPYVLWDLRSATSLLSVEEIEQLAAFEQRHAEQRYYGRIALVVRRLFYQQAQRFRSRLSAAPFEVQIFDRVDQAADWVGEIL